MDFIRLVWQVKHIPTLRLNSETGAHIRFCVGTEKLSGALFLSVFGPLRRALSLFSYILLLYNFGAEMKLA